MKKKETETVEEPAADGAKAAIDKPLIAITRSNAIILGLVVVIVAMAAFMFGGGDEGEPVHAAPLSSSSGATMAKPSSAVPAIPTSSITDTPPATMAITSTHNNDGAIERINEGRLFYSMIRIPPGAETLYLSGTGASQKADGTYGNMEEQAVSAFTKFKTMLEEQGWSMSDVVQVRAFAVAGEYGLLDFDGFNRGYSRFFGTPENPNKPVRSFVQVADLVVDGWLVEIEIRAARVP